MRHILTRVIAGLLLAAASASVSLAYEMDDTIPEVTDRVARISFLRGDVQIRRDGSQDWEKAELNLPIVEGDEIAVENGGRLEIQFSKDKHLRIDEASLVQLRQLSDSGVAISVNRGIVSVRLRKLDTDNEFFEIDGPGTTVALQKKGTYRFDAGRDDGAEVSVSVTDGGEARIYSASSGFSLRSGRSATVFISGNRVGEWEMSDASRFNDEFTAWADDRDSVIDKALAGAYYDKYYDQDIYGAEDLNAHGDWEYTSDYGYIWRPYQRSISVYNNWSPYRYGSWRWVPPYGWTWVNAEPWGWATYHYGRWIWYRGRWVWTPYSYYRTNRSWWYPALVVVQVINRNVCWYPLGWGRRYYNYNHGYHDWVGNRDRRRGGGWDRDRDRDPRPGASPTPTTGPVAVRERVPMPIERVPGTDPNIGGRERKPIDTPVPASGVISVSADSFGVSRRIGAIAPPEVANAALKKIDARDRTPVELPNYQTVRQKIARDISTTPPEIVKRRNLGVRVGASERQVDVPLDRDLRRTRILGDRQPLPQPFERPAPMSDGTFQQPRPTGAVTRDPMPRREQQVSPVERRPDTPPVVTPKPDVPRREIPRPRDETPRIEPMPRRDPPKPREEAPRRDPIPAPRQETPRPEPPPRRDPPKPREDAPRSNPPPRRESSPPERKPDPPKAERPAPKFDAGPSKKRDPIT